MADSIREAAERLLQQLDLKRSDPDCALRLEQAERDLRAAMAAEPQGEGLSDEELNALWNCSGIADEHGNHTGDIFEFARSAIAADRARWGRPAPPLAGEVGELVAALRSEAIHCTCSTLTSGDLRRAADLLTRLALQPSLPSCYQVA